MADIWIINRKINTSPVSLDDKDTLKKMLTTPPVKKIDLHFPLGLEVTARNLKGVTIKDALDAIYKQYRKKASLPDALQTYSLTAGPNIRLAEPIRRFPHIYESVLTWLQLQADDELENPVLAGFEWDKEESWTRLIVHTKKEGAPQPKKKSKKGGQEEEV